MQELGEYKVKYTQEVLEKHINSMSNKDDERLRKTTIAFLKDFAEQGYENAVECIEWLEKQGEQKSSVVDFKAKDWYVSKVDGKIHNIYYSVDKIEPKFKVGDYIVYRNYVWKVFNISLEKYYELLKINNEVSTCSIEYVDNNAHLWTIQDAKDGDVIFYDNGWACIFKCIHGMWYSSYCFITADGEFHIGYEQHYVGAKVNGDAHLATKEQRDTLMEAMAEAGYTFDFDKKKLKKTN